jgi:hypothetical protein
MLLNAYRAAAGLVIVLAAARAVVPASRWPVSGGELEAGFELWIPGFQGPDSRLITSSSMRQVRLGMTLAALRQLVPTASIERVSDGDGAALVRVAFGQDDSLMLSADEDDPDAPIDWSRKIITIETFSQTFHTAEGVRPGWLVEDVIKIFGPVREIVVSEVESRQFVTFENQPSWLTFRLDYAGVFSAGVRRTRLFKPGAKIVSILISHSGDHPPGPKAWRPSVNLVPVPILEIFVRWARHANQRTV